MIHAKENGIPEDVQERFTKPDMRVRHGATDAVVVFASHEVGFAAYCRVEKTDGESTTTVFFAPTRDEVIDAAVGHVFNGKVKAMQPVLNFRKYGGNQS